MQYNSSGNSESGGGSGGSGGGDKNNKDNQEDKDDKDGKKQKDDDEDKDDTDEEEPEESKSVENAKNSEITSSKLNPHAKNFTPAHASMPMSLEPISEHTILSNENENTSKCKTNQTFNGHASEPIFGSSSHANKNKKKNNKKQLFKERKLKLKYMYTRINSQPYFHKIEMKHQPLYISNKLIRNIKKKTLSTTDDMVIRNYMNRMFEVHHQTQHESKLDQALHFGFIDKESKQRVCCTLNQNEFKNKYKYAYKLNDNIQLLESKAPQYRFEQVIDEYIKQIKNCMAKDVEGILKNCDWNEIPIIFRKNDQFRISVSITKEQLFIQYSDNKNSIDLIPIVSCDNTAVDFAWIIKIHKYIYVALSLEYNEHSGNIRINGIHTDKQHLLMRHYLAYPPHINDCKCLNNFESIIHDINVGNTDIWFNKVKALKQHKIKTKSKNISNNCDSVPEITVNSPSRSTLSSISFSSPTVSVNSTSPLSTSLNQATMQTEYNIRNDNYFALHQQNMSKNLYNTPSYGNNHSNFR